MPTIGITGGPATGKSTLAALLLERGAVGVSADEIAREVLTPGTPAYRRVVERFGEEVLRPDGTIDRSHLGRIVFGDERARRDLEAITHPAILDRLQARLAELRERCGPDTPIVAEVPLLYEVGIESWFDRVVVVTAPEELQVQRLQTRDHLSREEALARIRAQMPLSDKADRADIVIVNDGKEETLRLAANLVFGDCDHA
jgi:dephospho-CoA kinase